MAGSRSQTLLRPSRDWTPLTQIGALNVANIISDDTRLAGVQGDGATYPASMAGVWPAATNIAAAVTITGVLGATVTNNSTEAPLFNGVSEKVVTPGAGLGEGGYNSILATGISGSTVYTVSEHVIVPLGATLRLRVTTFTAADAGLTSYDTTFVGTGARQVVTVTFTSDATAAKYRILVQTITSNQAITFYMGNGGSGLQLETGSIATPFTPSSRSAGSITMPAGVLDETQMWVAARLSIPWSSTTEPAAYMHMFGWYDALGTRIICAYESGSNSWVVLRTAGAGALVKQARTITAGDNNTVVFKLDAANVGISSQGAAFTSSASASIPVIAAATAKIGDDGNGAALLHGRFRWFAAGLGTLTDADAALFHAWGNNDPLPHMFPKSAQLSFLAHFNGDGTFYRRSA